MSAKPSVTELRQAADQCVKCAVCLPHCPTYALSPEETESPRGRITLLQGIVHERLEPTPETLRHLDNCLSCGRCEQVCPAQVPYTRLLDGSRFFMAERTLTPPPKTSKRLAARLLRSPFALRLLDAGARGARATGLDKLPGDSLPVRGLRWTRSQKSVTRRDAGVKRHDAWLFTGCLTDAFERDMTASALHVASAYGVTLKTTPSGLCCGALYQHQGNWRQSNRLTANIISALSSDDKPVVALPSGCARGLRDGLGFSDQPEAASVRTRLVDLVELLDRKPGPARITHDERVGFYAPCSLGRSQALKLGAFIDTLSAKNVAVLGTGHGCCGAAGDHMMHQPDRADRLAEPIVAEVIERGLTHVLTPNTGCTWHLRANLDKRGQRVVVEHPVQWISRHLRTASPKPA